MSWSSQLTWGRPVRLHPVSREWGRPQTLFGSRPAVHGSPVWPAALPDGQHRRAGRLRRRQGRRLAYVTAKQLRWRVGEAPLSTGTAGLRCATPCRRLWPTLQPSRQCLLQTCVQPLTRMPTSVPPLLSQAKTL